MRSVEKSNKKRTKKHKRQKILQYKKNDNMLNSGDQGDCDDDYSENDNSTSKSGVEVPVNDSTLNSGVDDVKSANEIEICANISLYRLDLNFGDAPY